MRQLRLAQVGETGQAALTAAKVVILGVGGHVVLPGIVGVLQATEMLRLILSG